MMYHLQVSVQCCVMKCRVTAGISAITSATAPTEAAIKKKQIMIIRHLIGLGLGLFTDYCFDECIDWINWTLQSWMIKLSKCFQDKLQLFIFFFHNNSW